MKAWPVIKYGLSNGSIAFAFGSSIAFTLYLAGAFDGSDSAVSRTEIANSLALTLVGWVLISPLVETIVALAFFKALSQFFSPKTSAVSSGVLLAIAHSFFYLPWGAIVVIPMVIFSYPLSDNRDAVKVRVAKSFTSHAVNNFIAFIGFASFALGS